jgi:hypothetical protein
VEEEPAATVLYSIRTRKTQSQTDWREEGERISILHKPRKVALICLFWLLFLIISANFKLYNFLRF